MAFIDFNGDCVADLFMTRQSSSGSSYYEIYSQQFVNDKSMYCLSSQPGQIVSSTDTMPLIEIADFNRDGMFDLMFLTQEGELTILYNKFKDQGVKGENLCLDTGDTASLKNDLMFAKYDNGFEPGTDVLSELLESWDPENYQYVGINPSVNRETPSGVPGRLRVADLN